MRYVDFKWEMGDLTLYPSAAGVGAIAGAEFSLIQKAGELGVYSVSGYLPNGQTSPFTLEYAKNTAVELAWSTVAGAGLGFLAGQLTGKFPVLNSKIQWNTRTSANPLPISYSPAQVSEANKGFLGTAADPNMTIAAQSAGRTLTAKNGKTVDLPRKESLITADAFAWIDAQSARIPELIKGIEGAQNKAIASSYWLNELKTAMRQAMKVPSDAVLLNKLDPFQNYNVKIAELGKTQGGDAKYDTLVKREAARLKDVKKDFYIEKTKQANETVKNACFVAGTLVHTINGLVPIEKLKVGDLVLSKPEHGGEASYKPVTKTFEHDFQMVYLLEFEGPFDENNWYNQDKSAVQTVTSREYILATGNHPFYARTYNSRFGGGVTGIDGWTEARNLGSGMPVEMIGGQLAAGEPGQILFHSDDPGIGYAPFEEAHWEDGGYYVEYLPLPSPIKVEYTSFGPPKFGPDPNAHYEIPMTVYNIEVQDNHTYYVGTLGLWVHNKNYTEVLSSEQMTTLTGQGENAGRLHLTRQTPPKSGNLSNDQVYERNTKGAIVDEFNNLVEPVIEFESAMQGKELSGSGLPSCKTRRAGLVFSHGSTLAH